MNQDEPSRLTFANGLCLSVLGMALVAGLATSCGTIFTVDAGLDAASSDGPDAASRDAASSMDSASADAASTVDGGSHPVGSALDAHALDKVGGATAAYGLRKLSSTYTGPLVNIMRASDSATEDVSPSSDDEFPTTPVAAWAQGGTIHVVTWYDQSGNHNDITQGTAPAAIPTLTLSAYRGRPGVTFSHAMQTYLTGTFNWVTGNGPWSSSVSVLGDVSTTNWYQPIWFYGAIDTAASINMGAEQAGNFVYGLGCYGSDFNSTIATTAPASFTASYDGTMYTGNVNGSSFQDAFSQQNITANTFWMGGSPLQSNIWLNGSLGDVILYPTALTPAQLTSLQDVEKAYYGF